MVGWVTGFPPISQRGQRKDYCDVINGWACYWLPWCRVGMLPYYVAYHSVDYILFVQAL